MTGQVLLQEAHAEADPEAPKPAVNEVAAHDAMVAPGADKDGLAGEVTPAAVDSTAASGDPIGEAVVALQEVMEPAPAPEPALEGELFYFLMESISCRKLIFARGHGYMQRSPICWEKLHSLIGRTLAQGPPSTEQEMPAEERSLSGRRR